MSGQIKVSDFIKASAKYVDEKVGKLHPDKSGKISEQDAKDLPKDLRDNLHNFDARGTGVSPQAFVRAFKRYVTNAAREADSDKDGFIESKNLPKDLRDNFANFVRAAGTTPAGGGASSKVAAGREALKDYIVNVLFNQAEPEGENFRGEILDHRDARGRAEVKAEMLAEAARWDPSAGGTEEWEKEVNGASTVYAGRFWSLYTELTFRPGKRPEVMIEID